VNCERSFADRRLSGLAHLLRLLGASMLAMILAERLVVVSALHVAALSLLRVAAVAITLLAKMTVVSETMIDVTVIALAAPRIETGR